MSAGDISRIPVLRASYQIRSFSKIKVSKKALVSSIIAEKSLNGTRLNIWFQFFKEKQHISQQLPKTFIFSKSNSHFQTQILITLDFKKPISYHHFKKPISYHLIFYFFDQTGNERLDPFVTLDHSRPIGAYRSGWSLRQRASPTLLLVGNKLVVQSPGRRP